MRIVITGGAGFVGANLVRGLLARDEVTEVRVVDDLSTSDKGSLAGLDLKFYEGSILDPALLDEAFDGADAVVHLAALPSVPRSITNPMATHHANATGTLEVLEAARRAGGTYVAAASSSSVYGANLELPKRESLRPIPRSPYAVSKLASESYLTAYHFCFDLPVLPFRPFNVYGPLQRPDQPYAAVIPKFIAAALRDQPLPMQGSGDQTRDFTFIGSVSQVLCDAVIGRVTNPTAVNLAFGTRISLTALVGEIEQVLGHAVKIDHLEPRVGDVLDSQADGSLLRDLFPSAKPVPLRDGLELTADWLRGHLVHLEG